MTTFMESQAAPDLSFCEDCWLLSQAVAPEGVRCARVTLERTQNILEDAGDTEVTFEGRDGMTISGPADRVGPAVVALQMQDVALCIESVQADGPPIIPRAATIDL